MWEHEPADLRDLEFGDIYHHSDEEACLELPHVSYITFGVGHNDHEDEGYECFPISELDFADGLRTSWTPFDADDVCRVVWLPNVDA
jgi:hypothetical protein